MNGHWKMWAAGIAMTVAGAWASGITYAVWITTANVSHIRGQVDMLVADRTSGNQANAR